MDFLSFSFFFLALHREEKEIKMSTMHIIRLLYYVKTFLYSLTFYSAVSLPYLVHHLSKNLFLAV